MKIPAFVWRESVYKNDFTCKCGTKLVDDKGYPNENVGVNGDDKFDQRMWCMKCRELVGVVKEVEDDGRSGKQGHYDEKKDGKLTEVECWGFAVGNISLALNMRKSNREFMRILKGLKGLMGVHPQYPHGNVLIFETENDAKGGRNILRYKGVDCTDIQKVYVDTRSFMKVNK